MSEREMVWGLYDTKDGVWMGNDAGPKTFSDLILARVAAQMIDMQLGQESGRTRAKEYKPGAKRLRDKVDTRMSSVEALRAIEVGRIQ
jgi:hypothetical protein